MPYRQLNPQEDLVNYFERSVGRGIKTKADLESYLAYAEEVRPVAVHLEEPPHSWSTVKQLVLAALFAIAVGQYIFIDVVVEIASLSHTLYFTPSSAPTESVSNRS